MSIYALASFAYLSSLARGDSFVNFNVVPDTTKNKKVTLSKDNLINDTIPKKPQLYKEALNSLYSEYWTKAEQAELDSLVSNNTWTKVLTKEVNKISVIKPLKTCWVYKIKESYDYYEFKARFVAKGFEQLLGLDYIESYASVIRQIAWKLIFALAIINS